MLYLNCEQQSYVSVAVKIEDHLTVSSWGLDPQAWCLFVLLLRVVPVSVWIVFRYSGFFPLSKDIQNGDPNICRRGKERTLNGCECSGLLIFQRGSAESSLSHSLFVCRNASRLSSIFITVPVVVWSEADFF